jgi:hypothetical protein
MLKSGSGIDGNVLSLTKMTWNKWKLAVLAIFAWIFFRAAFGYGSGEMSFAAVLVANADLAIHEFGHMLFCGGGEGICYAGGTILQFFVPFFCIFYFFLLAGFFRLLW